MPESEDPAAYTAVVWTETGRRLCLTLAESTPGAVRKKAVALVPDAQTVDRVTVLQEGTGPEAAANTDTCDPNG